MYVSPESNGTLEYKKITVHSQEESIRVQDILINQKGYQWGKAVIGDSKILDLPIGSTIYLGSELTKTIYLEDQILESERNKFDAILSVELQ